MIRKVLGLFRIRQEERWLVGVFVIISIFLHACCIYCFSGSFLQESIENGGVFYTQFQVSGYDPITYAVITHWGTTYQVFRHPLLAFMVYPLYLLNTGLIALTGYNLVQFLLASLLLVCNSYSVVFLYRIFRDIIGLIRYDATLLTAFFYGFAHIMVASIVPDHFTVSMFLLLFALYLSGRYIQEGKQLTVVQTVILFIITAGITLSNGVKIYLDALFVNGKRFFRPLYLSLAVIFPALLMWLFANWEYRTYVQPQEKARQAALAKKGEVARQRAYKQFMDTTSITNPEEKQKAFTILYKRQLKKEAEERWAKLHKGLPIKGKSIFLRWTDITTPRWDSMVENLFGESFLLHQDYLLGDTLRDRPLIVQYRWWICYVVEAFLVGLFLVGLWFGRKSRFLWLTFVGFAFDMVIHLVLGFGLNEVYIMASHWAFVIPIAIGYWLLAISKSPKANSQQLIANGLRFLVTTITLFLWLYNGSLLVGYLLG
ncbi:MAG: GtrA family protein [Prevotella sp.]|nr:GtrA family protein [Prevotella sp.]